MALFGIVPDNKRDQYMFLLIVMAAAWGYVYYSYLHQPAAAKIDATRIEIDSLQAIVDKAKQDLASGTVEDLRRKVDEYRANLLLMRRLVPEANEVPTLIDDISTKAKVRGVSIGRFEPLPVEPAQPFDTYRYRLEVYGHYDQIGEFLADIASLPRIVVPQDVALRLAQEATQRLLRDTVGGLLEVKMALRTYVKAPPPPPGAKPAAGRGNAPRR
jgi:type IV pilus assembly protein PilO